MEHYCIFKILAPRLRLPLPREALTNFQNKKLLENLRKRGRRNGWRQQVRETRETIALHFILSHHLWRRKISNSFNNTLLSEDGSRLPSESGTGQNNNITRAFYGKRATKKRIIPKKQTSNTLFCLHTHKVASSNSEEETHQTHPIRPTFLSLGAPPSKALPTSRMAICRGVLWWSFGGQMWSETSDSASRIKNTYLCTSRYYHKSQASSVESRHAVIGRIFRSNGAHCARAPHI